MAGFSFSAFADPVRQLLDEHVAFMDALSSMVEASGGESDTLTHTAEAMLEIGWDEINQHLNVHFVKEEEIFFPGIEDLVPGARVKFQYLHVDHDRLRECFEALTNALQDYRAVGPTSGSLVRI